MKTLKVQVSSGAYNVSIGADYKSIAEYVKKLGKARKVFVVSDTNVLPIYGRAIESALLAAGFDTANYAVAAGEENKRLSTIENLYEAFHSHGMTRTDIIIALGGGVIGDMTGFAAGTYLRGVPYIQVPTSLLAQIDASVGGKTGVDTAYGKNLVGLFNQPVAVLIDPNMLKTLSPEVFRDGMAEAIKYGLIKDAELYNRILYGEFREDLEELIYECISIKNSIVSQDERDQGERMLLNFGHTIGHAIEKCGNYQKYTHGQAVAIGMVYAAEIGEALGVTAQGTKEAIILILKKYALPICADEDKEQIYSALLSDKKKSGDTINFILLKSIGNAIIYPIDVLELKKLLGDIF